MNTKLTSKSGSANMLIFFLAIAIAAFCSEAHAERSIHVFTVFCNSYTGEDAEINDGVTQDKIIWNTVFTEYFSEASWGGVKLRRTVLEGPATGRAFVLTQFAEFSKGVSGDDTVFVHFSGHGMILDPAKGEQFLTMVDGETISRDEWARAIDALPCKLRIFITDCCSSYPPKYEVAEGDEIVVPWRNLYSLFLEHEGFVNITAASPGQSAYGTENGGFLTINLESDMQRFRSWEKVFAATQQRVFEETKSQIERSGAVGFSPQRPMAYSLGSPTYQGDEKAAPWVVPDSDQRRLSRAEIEGMGLLQIYLGRNEIFARHGYDFASDILRKHFESQSWYRARPGFKTPSLSDIETANVELLKKIEIEKGGPYFSSTPVMPGDSSQVAPDLFSFSSDRSLSRSLLQNLTPKELSIARNEIYARHGYPFKSRSLQDFFGRKPGYRRSERTGEPAFNAVEEHNLWLIRKIERINGGAYEWK